MFCGKCGAPNADNAAFCQSCGSPLAAAPAPAAAPETVVTEAPVQQPAANKNKLIGIIAIAAAVVVVAVVLLILLGGRSAKKTATQLFEGVLDGDGKAVLSLIHDDVLDEMLDDAGYDSKKEAIEEIDESLEYIVDEMKEEKIKVTIEASDTDDYKSKELKSIKELYEDEYDIKVKDAQIVEVKLTAKVDGEKETEKMEVAVIKVGGKWYLDTLNSGYLLSGVLGIW